MVIMNAIALYLNPTLVRVAVGEVAMDVVSCITSGGDWRQLNIVAKTTVHTESKINTCTVMYIQYNTHDKKS